MTCFTTYRYSLWLLGILQTNQLTDSQFADMLKVYVLRQLSARCKHILHRQTDTHLATFYSGKPR